jgi:hypothetical protein
VSLEFSSPPPSGGGGGAMMGADSPGKKRAASLREVFRQALALPPARVAKVKGNILIHVPNTATWTLVTSGPNMGVYDCAADCDVHFAMSCRDEVLLALFTDGELDLPTLISSKKLMLEGDVKVFGRFIELMSEVAG